MAELERTFEMHGIRAEIRLFEIVARAEATTCPVCRNALVPMRVPDGPVIDVCTELGVGLDRGELTTTLEAAVPAAGASESSSAPEPVEKVPWSRWRHLLELLGVDSEQ